jgi:NTP pyrophosphatase (non-canonical NTP hydrolase)
MSQQVSLGEMCEHLGKLFGPRNAIYLSGVANRIAFLFMGARNLEDVFEDNMGSMKYAEALASLFARICAIVENFRIISLPEAMSQKYPLSGCGYCGRHPCNCLDNKEQRDHQLSPVTGIQLDWEIKHWQDHIQNVYGRINHDRGVDVALHRLFSEIVELEILWMIDTHSESGYVPSDLRQQYALELSDAFAWVTVIASLLNINLEEAVISLYGLPGTPCHVCDKFPCDCGPFNMSHRRRIITE